ncbi:hypothetical protein ACHAXT_013305 [Thalassiosira profunda]
MVSPRPLLFATAALCRPPSRAAFAAMAWAPPPQNHARQSYLPPARVASRRRRRVALSSSIQPQWWTTCDVDDLPYDSALRALEAYHRVHGDLAIPGKYRVPATNEYPVEWHGRKLAVHIYNMKWWTRHVAQHNDRVAQLNSLGFIWERLQPQWNLFMEALAIYRNCYGDVMVPATFVVPRDENWPTACWDLPLGSIVQRLRLRSDFLTGDNALERKKQLDGLGMVWDVSEHNFAKFLKALRHFDRSQGGNGPSSLRVPAKFVVPSGIEHGWPPDLWGYPLGAKCAAVRQKQLYVKNHPERQWALDEIGFRWSGNATLGWLDVVHAAAIYSQLHGRELNVPFNFAVPAPPRGADANPQCLDSWPWPERLWGLKLGQRLKDVRLKGAYLKGPDAQVRKAQLDNLGMVWTPKRGRRKRYIPHEDVPDDDACTI